MSEQLDLHSFIKGAEGDFDRAELFARVRDHLWAAKFRIGGGDS